MSKLLRCPLAAVAMAALLATADATAAFEKMYWTDQTMRGPIKAANLDGSDVVTLVPEVNGPCDIAIDEENAKMYWATFAFSDVGAVERANLDGSDREVLVTADNPFGVAVDPAGGKLYWTEFSFFNDPGTIRRSNLDGSSPELLLTGDKPGRIRLDLVNQEMYWVANPVQGEPGPPRIKRAGLDGTGIEILFTGVGGNISGLALDLAAGKLYWSYNGIRRANLDGSGIETLVSFTGTDDAGGIAVDALAGKMYWVVYDFDGGPSRVQRANLDGSGVEDLVTEDLTQPLGIALGPDPFEGVPASSRLGMLVLVGLLGLAGALVRPAVRRRSVRG